MKKLFFLFLFPFHFFAQSLQVPSPLRFLALGDSYTIGQSVAYSENWPSQLMDSLSRRNIVIDTLTNFATTGWQTDDLLSAISNRQLDKYHYNMVSLLIGANNLYRETPLVQYITEFQQLLDSAIRYAGGDTSHVFVVSIPDFSATPFGQKENTKALSKSVKDYNAISQIFADRYHVRYFDIVPISSFGLFKPYLVADDGLHPSGMQYSEWVKLLLTGSLKEVLKDLEDKKLQVFPNVVLDRLTVSYKLNVSKTIELYNTFGDLVLAREMAGDTEDLFLKDLHSGLYILRVIYKGGHVSKKIIKQ